MAEKTVLWIAGWNLGGYMPEMDPYITTTWGSARDFLVEEIGRHADSLYDGLKTHKYFESGREEWSAQEILNFAEQNNDMFLVSDEPDRREWISLVDNDKEILQEIARYDDMLKELSEFEENTEWDGYAQYMHHWLHITERSSNNIPEDAEGDELEEIINKLNEAC